MSLIPGGNVYNITVGGGGGTSNALLSSNIAPFAFSNITGSSSVTVPLGSFTIPADAKSNSPAYLFYEGYGYTYKQPTAGNVCHHFFGVATTSNAPTANWIGPVFEVVAVAGPTPPDPQLPAGNQIPFRNYNFPTAMTTTALGSSWRQYPTWLTLSNTNPGDTVYAVFQDLYGGYTASNGFVQAPILLYTSAT